MTAFLSGSGCVPALIYRDDAQLPRHLFGVPGGGHTFFEAGLSARRPCSVRPAACPSRRDRWPSRCHASASVCCRDAPSRSASWCWPSRPLEPAWLAGAWRSRDEAGSRRVCRASPRRLCGSGTSRASCRLQEAACCWPTSKGVSAARTAFCGEARLCGRRTPGTSRHRRRQSRRSHWSRATRLPVDCRRSRPSGDEAGARSALALIFASATSGLVPAFSHGVFGEPSEAGPAGRGRPHRRLWTIGFPGDAFRMLAGQPHTTSPCPFGSRNRAPRRALARNSARILLAALASILLLLASCIASPTSPSSGGFRGPNNIPIWSAILTTRPGARGVIVFGRASLNVHQCRYRAGSGSESRSNPLPDPIRLAVCASVRIAVYRSARVLRILRELETELSGRAVSRCGSSAPAGGCAISCAPMASRTRLEASIAPQLLEKVLLVTLRQVG